jgi:hypothetical protein
MHNEGSRQKARSSGVSTQTAQASERTSSCPVTVILILWTSTLVAILAFAGWVIYSCQPLFSSASIGGNFTLLQAKGIDFVVGGVISPLIIASVNFFWFRSTRMTVFNEKGRVQRAVPLRALTNLATTNAGSYNIFDNFTFLETFRPRFILFGVLVLLSAISSTLLANATAYEATFGRTTEGPVTLQFLEWDVWSQWKYRDDISLHFANLLNTVTYYNATRFLENDSSYVTMNLTEASIANLSSSVTKLTGVPAMRQTITCEPAQILHFNLSKVVWPVGYMSPNITVGNESKYSL